MARFPMNAMLASGGYPWTVVWVEDRNALSRGAGSREHRRRYPPVRNLYHCAGKLVLRWFPMRTLPRLVQEVRARV
jgi:hypothetical protein